MSRRPNIGNVAAEAGVGVGTVSRVINGSPNVSEHTRERVLEVVERLQYRPNRMASGLSRGSTGAVAILIYDMTRAAMVGRLAGAISVLEEYGYDTVVYNAESPAQRDRHVRMLMSERRPSWSPAGAAADVWTRGAPSEGAPATKGRPAPPWQATTSGVDVHQRILNNKGFRALGSPKRKTS